ncbi:hypothetical protein [Mucilaginibacter sp.]|jgi:hypothetical protein|uniref:hypothetical protein n=1 Tax=Mucilaginibacter sp. TaxID=1882438 RepID=UPI003568C209
MKKLSLSVSIFFAALSVANAQWTTTTNATNTNTGYVGVSTGFYVTDGTYTLGSLAPGAALFGRTTAAGVYIPTSQNLGYNRSITLDQPNGRIHLIDGNSDQGGGISRPGVNTGETRFYSFPNYNNSQNFMTFYNNSLECMRILSNGSVGIGTSSPTSYFHGGINNVVEIQNPGTALNSQSQLVLSTGSVIDGSSAGAITWVSKNSTGFKGMAYIGSRLEGSATTNASASLRFATGNAGTITERMAITKDGNVGIGTANPDAKLTVNGTVHAIEVKVTAGVPADFVFEKEYKLRTLSNVSAYINKNKHLPDVPSGKVMKENGIDLSDFNMKLLQKIEELTLYLIEKDKQDKQKQAQIDALKQQVETLNKEVRKRK